jgi:hypothetical protein
MRVGWPAAVGVLLLAVCSPAQSLLRAAPDRPCRQHPQLSGPCFTIRGRMRLANGNPSIRIWRVGTKRILGVSDGRFKMDGYANVPPAVAGRLSWDTQLFGDFVVCPFTGDEPDVMRLICVDSASNLKVRPIKDR